MPGAFAAWLTLLERFGTMTLAEVLEPAIGYARHGYPVLPAIARTIGAVAELFTSHWPTSAAVYLPGGAPPVIGTRMRNPVLADTYERIVRAASGSTRETGIAAARDAFYRGFVAEAIDTFVRVPAMDTSGDGARRRPHRRRPRRVRGPDRGAGHLMTSGGSPWPRPAAWGQGPVFLQQLALLDGIDLSSFAPDDPELVHTVVESAKLAFADREAFYGDVPDVPLCPPCCPRPTTTSDGR